MVFWIIYFSENYGYLQRSYYNLAFMSISIWLSLNYLFWNIYDYFHMSFYTDPTGNVRWVLFHWHVWNSDEWFGEVGQFEEEKLNTLQNKSVRTLNYYIRKKSYVTLLNLLINHLLKDQSYIAALMSSKSPLSTPASQSWYRDRILNEADRFFKCYFQDSARVFINLPAFFKRLFNLYLHQQSFLNNKRNSHLLT